MVFLLLTVLLNAYISVVLKLFSRFRVDAFAAIVVNYCVCVLTGSIMLGECPIGTASLHQPWLPWALGLGTGFIAVFNIMAWSTRVDGITATTVANKLSLVIPVVAALFLYAGEQLHWTQVAGIACAIPAVYWSAQSGAGKKPAKQQGWLALGLLFLGSGLLDTVVTYVTKTFFSGASAVEQPAYLVHTFGTAAAVGGAVLIAQLALGKRHWSWRSLIAGIMLGVPNYFSLYYLLRLLDRGPFRPATAVPVANVGIVVASSLCAILLFRERATPKRWAGLGLAVIAILLLALHDMTHA